MSLVWDGGGEEDLNHIHSGGHSDMSSVGDGGEEDLYHVRSGGRSVTHVPNGGSGRRGGSQPCTQWGMLSDTCPQWGEEKRIYAMCSVGDTQ